MKATAILYLLVSINLLVHSQTYDLIVTNAGDSIACKIDSVSQNKVYFEMKRNGNWLHTHISKSDIIEHKFDEIKKKHVKFEYGSSVIISDSLVNTRVSPGKKNVLYGSIDIMSVANAIDINYERMLYYNTNTFISSLWLRFGGGLWTGWTDGGSMGLLTLTALTGKNKNHLEFNLGVLSFYDKNNYNLYLEQYQNGYGTEPSRSEYFFTGPMMSIGYRFQKPVKGFVFRSGFNLFRYNTHTPQTSLGAYISFGIRL